MNEAQIGPSSKNKIALKINSSGTAQHQNICDGKYAGNSKLFLAELRSKKPFADLCPDQHPASARVCLPPSLQILDIPKEGLFRSKLFPFARHEA